MIMFTRHCFSFLREKKRRVRSKKEEARLISVAAYSGLINFNSHSKNGGPYPNHRNNNDKMVYI